MELFTQLCLGIIKALKLIKMTRIAYLLFLLLFFTTPLKVLANSNDRLTGPTAICHSFVVVSLDPVAGVAALTPDMIDAGSYDLEGPVTLSISPTSVDCDDVMAPVIAILTVTDTDGNTNQCWTEITVVDHTIPTAVCYSLVHVSLDAFGQASIGPEVLDAGSSDNCEMYFSLSQSNFDCSDIGSNNVNMYVYNYGEDPINYCWSEVIIEDKIGPTAICQAQVNLSLDASGQATLTPDMIDAGSYDNCSIDLFLLSESSFDCDDIGETVVQMKTIDAGGNVNSCWSKVYIEDKMPPVAVCQSTVYLRLNLEGKAVLTRDMVDAGSYDNCKIVGYSLSKKTFTCEDGGSTIVEVKITDQSGNMSTCNVEVIVADEDCDGVADFCDVCPGGDDSVDNNGDNIPDCSQAMPWSKYSPSWRCKGKGKILVCHKGKTKCYSASKAELYLKRGDFIGPCSSCPTKEFSNDNDSDNLSLEEGQMNIFPNPSSGEIQIYSTSGVEISSVKVHNMMGQLQFDVHDLHSVDLRLDLYSRVGDGGVYLISIVDMNGNHFSQLITLKR